MIKFLSAHAKAITAFLTSEGAALVVVLQNDKLTGREIILALLLPLVVGGATSQIPNKPAAPVPPAA